MTIEIDATQKHQHIASPLVINNAGIVILLVV